MNHNKMMVNSLQSELGIGNDFNRRLRNDETGETLQEIKTEDDERTKAYETLLTEYNKNLLIATTQDDKDEVTNKYEDDKKTEAKKYNKPTIMKIKENDHFNKVIEKSRKISKKYDSLQEKNEEEKTHNEVIENLFKNKKEFYRLTKEEKVDLLVKLMESNANMNKEIKIKEKFAEKISKNYLKKVENKKIEKEKSDKEYLNFLYNNQNEEEKTKDASIELPTASAFKLDKLEKFEIIEQINKICNLTASSYITPDERNTINKIFANNGYDVLGPKVTLKSNRDSWLKLRQII